MEVNLPELNRRLKAPRIRTRSGRTPRARVHGPWAPGNRHRVRTRLLQFGGVCLAGLVIMAIGGDVYANSLMSSLPNIQGLDAATYLPGDTLIYDRNGKLLADEGNGGNHRQVVTLDQVSPVLVKATVDVEDRTFWTNQGYDPQSIVRAALGNVRHSGVQSGASTITQQLAKELFLGPQQTYTRKIKELMLAYRLNSTYSKTQILDLYLNENDYGERQYGIQAASKTYFLIDAKNLDLAQASLLAGLPQAPFDYDPVNHMDAAKARQQQVLAAMLRQGDITALQAQQAYAEPLTVHTPTNSVVAPGADQFVSYVDKELGDLGYKVGTQQMVVRTTLDWGKQQLGQQIVTANLNKNKYRDPKGGLNSSLVALDPKTGQILTYVGSAGGNSPGSQYDFAGTQYENPGSSVKPYTYAAAINGHYATMDTQIFDGPVPYLAPKPDGSGTYPVKNFVASKGYGEQPLRVAFANSLNISAVKTEEAVGVYNLVDVWRNTFGLRPEGFNGHSDPAKAPVNQYGVTLTLGGHAITMLQHAAGLAVFADLGTYHPPEAILSVTDARGKLIYQADPNRGAKQTLDPGVAFIVSSILGDDNNRSLVFGRGTPLHLTDRHAAAKTGTTDDFHDGLTVGWTPDLVSVLWMGDVLGSSDKGFHMVGANTDGVYVAAPAWHQFMEQALRGVPDHWYAPPSDVVRGSKGDSNSWFLTAAPASISNLPGDKVPSPSPGDFGVPADPGPPVPVIGGVPIGRGRPSPVPIGG